MKAQKIISVLIALTLWSCNAENKSTSFGLTVEDSFFAKLDYDGLLVAADNTFKQGEDVVLALINVSGFKKGDDGLNSFEMEMEVYDMENKLILSLGNLLGESGHINLESNTAESPYASLTNTENLQPGKYKFSLAIYDKIGGGSATQTKTFIIN